MFRLTAFCLPSLNICNEVQKDRKKKRKERKKRRSKNLWNHVLAEIIGESAQVVYKMDLNKILVLQNVVFGSVLC